MGVLRVIIFASTLLSYAWVQAKCIHNDAAIIDRNEDITRDNVGIAGGTEVTIEEAPYVVALYHRGEAFGSGSIIHEQFILTSASVVKNVNDSFHVLFGTDQRCAGGKLEEVVDRLCHEHFCDEHYSDICLLKLREPLQLGPKIAKIGLAEKDSEFDIGSYVNVAGWGMTENNIYPDHLRRARVPLLDGGLCSYYNPNLTMTDNMICAGTPDLGPCVGDGGAPLTLENMQIGVSSLVAKDTCGPAVFTKVSKFVSWIEETISKNL